MSHLGYTRWNLGIHKVEFGDTQGGIWGYIVWGMGIHKVGYGDTQGGIWDTQGGIWGYIVWGMEIHKVGCGDTQGGISMSNHVYPTYPIPIPHFLYLHAPSCISPFQPHLPHPPLSFTLFNKVGCVWPHTDLLQRYACLIA